MGHSQTAVLAWLNRMPVMSATGRYLENPILASQGNALDTARFLMPCFIRVQVQRDLAQRETSRSPQTGPVSPHATVVCNPVRGHRAARETLSSRLSSEGQSRSAPLSTSQRPARPWTASGSQTLRLPPLGRKLNRAPPEGTSVLLVYSPSHLSVLEHGAPDDEGAHHRGPFPCQPRVEIWMQRQP